MIQRLYECLYVHQWSSSKMHLGIFVFGLLHYVFTPFSFLSINYKSLSDEYFIFCLILFIIGSYIQMKSHKILAKLRIVRKDVKYSNPKGFLFNYIYCPHYLGELIMYLSFILLSNFSSMNLNCCVIWVWSNQFILSYNTKLWYNEKFKEEDNNRKAIIPFII